MIPSHLRRAVSGFTLGALATGALAIACGARPPPTLIPEPAAAPAAIRQACELTTQRCSHCHPIDRLTVAHGIGMRRWALFVDEMRRKPSSGISPDDAQVVLTCLRFTEEQGGP